MVHIIFTSFLLNVALGLDKRGFVPQKYVCVCVVNSHFVGIS